MLSAKPPRAGGWSGKCDTCRGKCHISRTAYPGPAASAAALHGGPSRPLNHKPGHAPHRIKTPAASTNSSEGTATSPNSALDASNRCVGRMRTV